MQLIMEIVVIGDPYKESKEHGNIYIEKRV